ncbi:c-type cytochrome [Arenibaculum pallidiluteum]|uniref:c-type cytochrome n=1 Tax=Arenibaculum pallidiluteum TaxID=2812559 RepID=UPI001A961E35|nr:cytochrome c [Arenibaculum pallidiluteum]
MRIFAAAAMAGLLLAGAGVAGAQSVSSSGATIKERQEHMKAMGGAMRTLGNYVKKEGGVSLDDAKKAATTLNERASGPVWTLFPAGSIGDSAARPEIWSQEAQFKKAAADFQQASSQLVQAVNAGQDAQIAQAFGATGKTCGTCHEAFRVKK